MSNWIIKELEKKAWAEHLFPELQPFYAKMLERGTRRAVMTGAVDVDKYMNKKKKRKDGQ